MRPTAPTLLPLALGLLGSPLLDDDRLRCEPAPASTLMRTFGESTTLELESVELSVDGGLVEMAPEVSFVVRRTTRFTDEVARADAQRLLELTRAFEEIGSGLEMSFESEGDALEISGRCLSQLEGSVVRFAWDEASSEHERAFELGDPGEEGILDGLEVDADLRGFLPSEPVKKGDTWQVEPAALRGLFAPSGDLVLLPAAGIDAGYESIPAATLLASYLGNLGDAQGDWTGTIKAESQGSTREVGRHLAEVDLELDVESRSDKSALLRRYVEETEGATGRDLELAFEIQLEGSGTLVWDLERNHLHSLELDGEVGFDVKLSWTDDVEGGAHAFDASYRVTGATRVEAKVD
jgi:hypothetical protein